MAEKDIAEKTLEAYDDVFADIVNVLLFQGRHFVKEEELEERACSYCIIWVGKPDRHRW